MIHDLRSLLALSINISIIDNIDKIFSNLVQPLEKIFFFSIGGIPLIILWLIGGGLFCTCRMGFINVRGFQQAIDVISGKYDHPHGESEGEISHFQALSTALSGTVGLGNIAGVAIAIQVGGPGAVFWMTLTAFLGMSSKFVECTLGVKYRQINPDGTVSGGPMYYLSQGLSELGYPKLGKVFGVFFAIFCMAGRLTGGNMFQVNQSFAALAAAVPLVQDFNWLFGLVAATLVGSIIFGGLSRIAVVTSRLLPVIILAYAVACLWVVANQFQEVPGAINLILQQAFSPEAFTGGLAGAFVQGVRRSAFSNGAGLGSAAIAHATARTDEPVREGIVSTLEPFIDTIVVCNLTALVIVLTGTYGNLETINGSAITSAAFAQVIDWFPPILAVMIFLFALSTTIGSSYLGERCWAYLLGEDNIIAFKFIFLFCTFFGAIVNLNAVVDLSDMMLLAMSVPNLIACIVLSPQVGKSLDDYLKRMKLDETISQSN